MAKKPITFENLPPLFFTKSEWPDNRGKMVCQVTASWHHEKATELKCNQFMLDANGQSFVGMAVCRQWRLGTCTPATASRRSSIPKIHFQQPYLIA